MLRIISLLSLIALWISAVSVQAADPVRIGFKSGKAPYVMASVPLKPEDYDLSRQLGIEIDLVKAAMSRAGNPIEPVYMNYNRMPEQISNGDIQAASNMTAKVEGVHYVEGLLRLHDYIIVNKKAVAEVTGLGDLKGKRVVAFQRASEFLGDGFAEAIKTFSSYREIDDQEKQVRVFFAGRTDALITDISIFKHWAKQHGKPGVNYSFTPVFKEALYFGIAFRDKSMADAFEKGLAEIKASGEYDEIYGRYLD